MKDQKTFLKISKNDDNCGACQESLEFNAAHGHHITYEPCNKVKLCRSCHHEITVVNTLASRVVGRKLESVERIALWKYYLKNRLDELADNVPKEFSKCLDQFLLYV